MAPTIIRCAKQCNHNQRGFCFNWQARTYWGDLRKPVMGKAQVSEKDDCKWCETEE